VIHKACGTVSDWQHDGVCMRSSHDFDPFCDCASRLKGLWWCPSCRRWFDAETGELRA
jgi:hypothetical protein